MRIGSGILFYTAVLTLARPNDFFKGSDSPMDKRSDILEALQNVTSCCSALALFLPTAVSFPATPAYDASLASYWDQQEEQMTPACIVQPTSPSDVSIAVTLLSAAYTRGFTNGCHFAVRSGGHMAWGGAANIQAGVTLDLQLLDQVSLSPDQRSVALGPGSRWGEVYTQLGAQNVAVTGGRVSGVGVGGLILGGGFSFFSARYGLVCSNVINYQIVLASGNIVNANASSNADLYKALKGGGNNFGIVTRFDMVAFEQGVFWGGTIFQACTSTNRAALFQAFQSIAQSSTYDPYAALIQNFAYTVATGWLIISDIQYTKPRPYPPVFASYFAVPQISSTMRIDTLASFATEINTFSNSGLRQTFLTMQFRNDEGFMEWFFQQADAMKSAVLPVTGLIFSFTYQPVSQIYLKNQEATGGNVLGLEPSDGDMTNLEINAQWTLAADDAAVMSALKQLLQDAVAEAKDRGVWNDFVYYNYAEESQKPISGYGEQNRAFLMQVSEKYDPGQVFQNAVPGGFKLATS